VKSYYNSSLPLINKFSSQLWIDAKWALYPWQICSANGQVWLKYTYIFKITVSKIAKKSIACKLLWPSGLTSKALATILRSRVRILRWMILLLLHFCIFFQICLKTTPREAILCEESEFHISEAWQRIFDLDSGKKVVF
jgi:hypothetical protein